MSEDSNARHGSYRRYGWLLVGLGGLAGIAGLLTLTPMESTAEMAANGPDDRHVTNLVIKLMRDEHLSKNPIDDEISRRAIKIFLRQLDPAKLYFMQSDIDNFMAQQDQLDDYVKRGDISFAHDVFKVFLRRVDERTRKVPGLLALDHDFTLDEEMMVEPDEIKYAATEAEADERWRQRIKYELLAKRLDDMKDEEAKEKIAERFRSTAKRAHQTDREELLEMFLSSITTSFDPHTTYMSPSNLENFNITMKLNLEGIGAALEPDNGFTKVTKIIPGGAADKMGKLKPEDRIVSVGQGDDGELVDVVDMKLGDVVKLIRGRAGTVVRLGVNHVGETETNVYKITRARIELTDSEARGEIIEYPLAPTDDDANEEGASENGDSAARPTGKVIQQQAGTGEGAKKHKIGVIDLPSFYMDMSGARRGLTDFKSTTRDVRVLLEDFTAQGVDIVVLDLRHNGGGSLTEAINLTGLFIDTGPVVQVKDADDRVQHYDDVEGGMAWSGPLVVLISKFSASASEILAGAIQDYQRGIIVGDDTTHGKGTVQSLLDLGSQIFHVPDPPNLGALKITMQQFYRPNGDSTQKRGVLADVVLPSVTSQMDVGEADLDYALEFDRVRAAHYQPVGYVTNQIVAEIRDRSKSRREADPEFQELRDVVKRYREQKDRKSVTLNEAKLRSERKAVDAGKEDEKQFLEQAGHTERDIFRRDFYGKEILAISEDYLELLHKEHLANAN